MGSGQAERREPAVAAAGPGDDPHAPRWALPAIFVVCLLAALSLIGSTWRRSGDPVVDFGRELYGAWRIVGGAVLYRDFDHDYGPLSQYWYSLVFRLFDVGLGRYLWANLAVWIVALWLLVRLVFCGWGPWPALASGLFFVMVLSFSNIVGFGNYNFLTPYVADATNGFVVCLGVATALTGAVIRFKRWKVFVAGWLAGLCVLLKPEPILASVLMASGTAVLAWLRAPRERRAGEAPGVVGLFLAGWVLPIAAAATSFRVASVSWGDAIAYANNAWLVPFTMPQILDSAPEHYFRGTSAVGQNLSQIARWSAGAAVLLCVSVAAARFAPRALLGIGVAVVCWIMFALAWDFQSWMEVGFALPFLVAVAAVAEAMRLRGSRKPADAAVARILLWLFAVGYAARMGIYPRLYHYGFTQGAAAAIVALGVLTYWAPSLAGAERARRVGAGAMLSVVLVVCCVRFVQRSEEWRSLRTQPLGEGDDLLYVLGPESEPTGLLVELLRQRLVADRSISTLTVMPEGVFLNYLVRKPSPVATVQFFPPQLGLGLRARNRARMRASPPDAIVLISRDMREHGVARFGRQLNHGGEMLRWVEQNYVVDLRLGGDALDPAQRGATLLLRGVGPERISP